VLEIPWYKHFVFEKEFSKSHKKLALVEKIRFYATEISFTD
jgi:hypothetical protein